MLKLTGAKVHKSIKMGWMVKVGGGFHSEFTITRTVELMVRGVGFNWENIIQFYVAVLAPDHIVLGHLV